MLDLAKYWEANPPVHIILAGIVGKGDGSASKPSTESDVSGLLAMLKPEQVGPPQHGT